MKIRLITINGIEFFCFSSYPERKREIRINLSMPLFDLSVLQSSQLYCYCTLNFNDEEVELTYKSPLLCGRFPPQENYQTYSVPSF